MSDIREQVAREIDSYPWHEAFNDPLFGSDSPIGQMRERSLRIADAALAVAEPAIRADERERLAQKAGPDAVHSFVTNDHGGIVRAITFADWLRAQADEPDDRKIYIGFKDKPKDKGKEDDK